MANPPDDNLNSAKPTPNDPDDDEWGGEPEESGEGEGEEWQGELEAGSAEAGEAGESDDAGPIEPPPTTLDNAVWHAPRGRLTRLVAVILLVLMAVCVLTLALMVILSALD